MKDDLLTLLSVYVEEEVPPIIILENFRHESVGALYLNKLNIEDIIICQNENKLISDKYYVYSKTGLSIYFTYHRKIEGPKLG